MANQDRKRRERAVEEAIGLGNLAGAIRLLMEEVSSPEDEAEEEGMNTFSMAGFTVGINDAGFKIMGGNCGNGPAYGFVNEGPGTYQVPAGKKLLIIGATFTGNSGFTFGYCDNDPGRDGTALEELVNPVRQGDGLVSLVADADGKVAVGFEVPAGKFPFNRNGDGGLANGTYYCLEQDA